MSTLSKSLGENKGKPLSPVFRCLLFATNLHSFLDNTKPACVREGPGKIDTVLSG